MDQIAGILLCGGNSRRMGQDKALLSWRGQPLVRWQADRLSLCTSPLIVAAGYEQQLPPLPTDVRVVNDPQTGRGPLPALAEAFTLVPHDRRATLVLAVDLTGFDLGLLEFFRARLATNDAVVCFSAGKLQPLAALYGPGARSALGPCLTAGQASLSAWLDRLKVDKVPEDEWRSAGFGASCFANLNTPADYAAANAADGHGASS